MIYLFTLNISLNHVSLLDIDLSLLLSQNALSLTSRCVSLGNTLLLPAVTKLECAYDASYVA